MAVRGIVAAFSKNERPDLVPDDVLMTWYDNIHIPDVVATSGMPTALRFEAVDPSTPLPWLVIYPTDDINFTKSDEFNRIAPGGHPEIKGYMYPDLAKIDLRICERTHIHDSPQATPGRTPNLVALSVQPPAGMDDDFDKWYRDEYLEKLDRVSSFRRATAYNLVSSLTEGSPRRLALLEFETADIPWSELARARGGARAEELLSKATVIDEFAFKLMKEAGDLSQTL